jgi:hypothetical protein
LIILFLVEGNVKLSFYLGQDYIWRGFRYVWLSAVDGDQLMHDMFVFVLDLLYALVAFILSSLLNLRLRGFVGGVSGYMGFWIE